MKPSEFSKRSSTAMWIGLAIAMIAGSSAFAGQSISYSYDALGRVVTVNYGNGVVVTYTYDKAGNRTARTAT